MVERESYIVLLECTGEPKHFANLGFRNLGSPGEAIREYNCDPVVCPQCPVERVMIVHQALALKDVYFEGGLLAGEFNQFSNNFDGSFKSFFEEID